MSEYEAIYRAAVYHKIVRSPPCSAYHRHLDGYLYHRHPVYHCLVLHRLHDSLLRTTHMRDAPCFVMPFVTADPEFRQDAVTVVLRSVP